MLLSGIVRSQLHTIQQDIRESGSSHKVSTSRNDLNKTGRVTFGQRAATGMIHRAVPSEIHKSLFLIWDNNILSCSWSCTMKISWQVTTLLVNVNVAPTELILIELVMNNSLILWLFQIKLWDCGILHTEEAFQSSTHSFVISAMALESCVITLLHLRSLK